MGEEREGGEGERGKECSTFEKKGEEEEKKAVHLKFYKKGNTLGR